MTGDRIGYDIGKLVRKIRDLEDACNRTSDACATVQRERDEAREMLASVATDIRELVSTRLDYIRMSNGERRSIEGDDGEKCWLVHSDPMFALEAFLARYEAGE